MKYALLSLLFALEFVAGESIAEPSTNLDTMVAQEIVEWISLCQHNGVRDESIVAALKTNENFVASNVWMACFNYSFDSNNVPVSVEEYGKRVNVAVCLRPFSGIEAIPDLFNAYTRFCDIGASCSFGTPNGTNSLFLTHPSKCEEMKGHFLKLMNFGPFFRRVSR